MKPKDESYGVPAQTGYYGTLEPFASSVIKVVTLRRRGNAPLGFSIRGGWEHGTGVFISEIMGGSIAQKQGLRVGDQIVRINGFSIHRAIHMEVLSLLKTCPSIVLKIKRVGILPVKERDKDPVSWKVVEPETTLNCTEQVSNARVISLENNIIVKIEINVPGSSSLGCSIAKGPSELPGIFMCTVKSGGAAERAGLQVGDQIIDMNGTSFHELKLSEAVALMKSAKDVLRLTVKKGAGLSLFLDNASVATTVHGEDALSTARSISDGISTTLKDHAFSSGSSSSKSEGSSSFQSSDSEKDYSLSEESASEGLSRASKAKWPPTNHKKQPSSSSSSNSQSTYQDNSVEDSWIEEEKRRLEEGRRKLEAERKQLEEERKKLEAERSGSVASDSSTSQPTSIEDTSSLKENSFLNELQKVAAKMSNGKGFDERNAMGFKTTRPEVLKGKRGKEDEEKRMQHEMLMEEFRAAHRKMFGQTSVLPVDENKNGSKPSDEPCLEMPKVSIKAKSPPPPPPPKTPEHSRECQKITVNGQVPGFTTQAVLRQTKSVPADDARPSVRITVGGARRLTEPPGTAPKPKVGTLVEVTPWTTRL